uniref:Uncharacterized protein n=1 Tax=Chenopodium quinoa TaxID=63459 RepID=A0A803MUG9_CHEQI
VYFENAGSTGPRDENGWINGLRDEVNPSPGKVGADYYADHINRSSPNLEEEPRPNKLSPFDKRLLCFVRGWKELKNDAEPGSNLILCDGVDASQRDYYRVVSPRSHAGDHYVRVASVLYMKTWASQHTRKRIMMDPLYAEKHTSSLRNNLFLEDVNSDFNELHANLETILPKERRGGRRKGSHMTS